MEVDRHISELLFDHDCVIVPSLGGFLASYQHATIHPTQHSFSPPSKKIAFNIFLKQNDGLLANHIAGLEKLSYTDALQQIEFFVSHCNKELTDGKKIMLNRIGVLYFDSEKNLQFEPAKNINYLRDAFGFSSIQYLPVKRDNSQWKAERQLKEIIGPRASVKAERKTIKLKGKSTKKTIGYVIISGALLWLSFNLYMIAPRHFDLGTLNPFGSKNKSELNQQPASQVTRQQAIVSPIPVETTDAATSVPLQKDESIAMINKEEKKETATPVQNVVADTGDKKYFIIGGAFQFQQNAEAFVNSLHAEGFPEAQILDSTKHLKMVCFNGFSTRLEATAELDKLKAANKNGWIYAR